MALRKSGNLYFGEFSDLKELVKKSGNEFRYNCPYCAELIGEPDRKGKFYYNEIIGAGHCFRCDCRIVNDGLRSLDLIRQQLDQIPDQDRYAIQAFNVTGWTWPVADEDGTPQLSYMLDTRRISKSTLDHFQILACDSPNKGIVFCNKLWHADGSFYTDFFQLRQIQALPKYVNLRDIVKPLSWLDYTRSKNMIMIVEGFISGIASYQHMDGTIDPVILGGKTISKVQINQLKEACEEKDFSQVYVILDGGYLEEAIRVARKLERELLNQDIFIVKLPFKKDPNELTTAQFRSAFKNHTYHYTRLAESCIRNEAYGKKK
jgi:hypothetical protein